MKKTIKADYDEMMKADREIERRQRHTLTALRTLGLKPETFGFKPFGKSLVLNEHAESHMLDLALGLSLGMSDKLAGGDKNKALVELLQTLDPGVVSALLDIRG